MNPCEPVPHPITDVLDLHTFCPKEVAPLLDDYLEAAAAAGYRRVIIVHGKGRGILKRRVRCILARHRLVRTLADADAGAGGWGATVVELTEGEAGEARAQGPDPGAAHGGGAGGSPERAGGRNRRPLLRGMAAGILLALFMLWLGHLLG